MTITVAKAEGRFARFERIEWWDQASLSRLRVLVVGAGALGNEVIKNLALLGVGHLVIVDMDRVERSNLSRSVLFRETDEGHFKAECAARAAAEVYPSIHVTSVVGNVLADVGLGYFRWADVVIGALDNREARVFVNAACARTGRPWFDGGIDVLQGIVRGFSAPQSSCYECTMGAVDWELLNRRRSCSLVARRAAAAQGVPTTPTIASIIAAIQVQEMVKHIHGLPALIGRGLHFDGSAHQSCPTTYPINPDCPWHEIQPSIEAAPQFNRGTSLREIWEASRRRIGGVDAIDFGREIVARMECPACTTICEVYRPAENISDDQLVCPRCGAEASPVFMHSVGDGPHLDRTLQEFGLPAFDIVWARYGATMIGWEISGDIPEALETRTPLSHATRTKEAQN